MILGKVICRDFDEVNMWTTCNIDITLLQIFFNTWVNMISIDIHITMGQGLKEDIDEINN